MYINSKHYFQVLAVRYWKALRWKQKRHSGLMLRFFSIKEKQKMIKNLLPQGNSLTAKIKSELN